MQHFVPFHCIPKRSGAKTCTGGQQGRRPFRFLPVKQDCICLFRYRNWSFVSADGFAANEAQRI
jgi:hypothetical protein